MFALALPIAQNVRVRILLTDILHSNAVCIRVVSSDVHKRVRSLLASFPGRLGPGNEARSLLTVFCLKYLHANFVHLVFSES